MLALAGVVAVALGILVGTRLADPGEPLVEPSPTPVPTATPTASPPSPTGSPSPSPAPTAPDVEAPSVETASLSSSTPPSEGRPAIEVDVDYPQLVGLADADVQDRVNRSISEAMQEEVDAFVASAEPAQEDTPPHSIWSDTTVGAVDPTVLSVVVPVTTYQGGAHPYTIVRTFTFDLTTGAQVELTDLFDDGILERVSGLAVERIQDEYGTGDWADEGAAPTDESLGRFVLTAGHLQVWFDNYQVGPYAIGTPSVDIPYDALADLIPPGGVVAQLAAS